MSNTKKTNKKTQKKDSGKFSKRILICIAIYALYFNERCFWCFMNGQPVPDAFIVGNSVAIVAELLNLAMVKVFKVKRGI